MKLGQVGRSNDEKGQELGEEWGEAWARDGADSDRMGLSRASVSPMGRRKGSNRWRTGFP